MKTINSDIVTEYEIKNSKFITLLYKIDNDFNISDYLDVVKESYPKATHYCYAYRTLTTQKSSDDGEPGGTAGIPMLNVLIKEELVNVLAITVRYFGGIKLGAGGLVRAYTKSLTTALSAVKTTELEDGFLVRVIINYDMQKQLDYLLKDIDILDKSFNENVFYYIEISKNNLSLLDGYKYEILENRLVKKKEEIEII